MYRSRWVRKSSTLPVLAVLALLVGCTAAPATPTPTTAAAAALKPTAVASASPAAVPPASAAIALSPVAKPLASPSAAPAASVLPAPSPVAAAAPTSLKGICPDNVVLQTNWWPEPDHGIFYQLIGPNGVMDANKNTYSGPLGTTGVNAEIRAGGPAIGFQPVTSQLYQDDNILLGMVATDVQIGTSATQPTKAVLAWYARNPQILFWGNPDWNFTSVGDIGTNGATVLAFPGAPYLDLFQAKHLLTRDQIDTSYTGDPSRFVAADGNIVSQGLVTAEPYIYEHEVNGWMRPVKFLLLDKEVPVYQNTVAIRADKLEANRACLQKLVPLLQRAGIDYVKHPGPVNAVLGDFTAKIKGGTQISAAGALDAVQRMLSLGIVSNGTDGVFGSYNAAQVQALVNDFGPVFGARGKPIKDGLQPADIFTNEFLDKAIKL